MFPTAQDLPPGNFYFESLAHAAATYRRSPESFCRPRGSLVSKRCSP